MKKTKHSNVSKYMLQLDSTSFDVMFVNIK